MELAARDVCRPVIKLEYNRTLYDVRNILLRYGISRIVVEKGGKPAGIITEKDVSRFLYTTDPGRRLDETRLDELLKDKKELVTVSESTRLKECAKLMLANNISSLLVSDSEGNGKWGILTKTDLLDAYSKYFAGKATVGDYMTRKVITVEPDEPIHTVLLLMTNAGISRIVVMENGKPAGMITGRDMAAVGPQFAAGGVLGTGMKSSFAPYLPSGIRAMTLAKDVMKTSPIAITDYSDLMDAAAVMRGNRISGMPVIDSAGSLVGIITSTDITRAMANID